MGKGYWNYERIMRNYSAIIMTGGKGSLELLQQNKHYVEVKYYCRNNNQVILGATAESNGQQATVTSAGSVGSYQSSGGSPESHSALSPAHSPRHNGALSDTMGSPSDQNGLGSPIVLPISDADYRIAFKQVNLPKYLTLPLTYHYS